MNVSFRFSLVTLFFIILSGCSLLTPRKIPERPSNTVYLSPDVQWKIPSANTLKHNFQITQSVQALYKKQQIDLIFQVEKNNNQLVIVAMTPSAQPLLQIQYQGIQLRGKVSPLTGNNIPLEYLVSDFILAFGQPDSVKTALADVGAQLINDDHQRAVAYKNQTIITIDYFFEKKSLWPDIVTFHNQALDYSLSIKTLSFRYIK